MKKIKGTTGLLSLYLGLFIGVLFILVFSSRCTYNKLPPVIQKPSGGDTLDVAVVYGPLSYYIEGDSIRGINAEILKSYERQCSIPIKFIPVIDTEETYKGLEGRLFDIFASVPSDYDVRQKFLTSESVYLDRLVLIQRKNKNGSVRVNSALDLAGDTVNIARGSSARLRLNNLEKEIGEKIYINELPETSEEFLCIKVATGDLGLAVVNEKVALAMEKQYPDLSFNTPVSFTQFQSWIMSKGDSIRFKNLNEWLIEFQKTPEYREIIEKYYN